MTECETDRQGDGAIGWRALRRELDAWRVSGRTATLWWRDDDAREPGPRLDRLLAVAAGLPLALAVIPCGAGQPLARRIARQPNVDVLQHGYDHRNHAPASEKRAELGPHRADGRVLREIADGRARLAALFGRRFTAVLAPPWNRIANGVAAGLPGSGIRALTCFGARQFPLALPQANAHLDIIDWRGTRGFIGESTALSTLIEHLRRRRSGATAAAIPSGLLTHHRDNDAAAWRFLERLVDHTKHHRGARWVNVHDVFRAPRSNGTGRP